EEAEKELSRTSVVQPASFIVNYGLAKQWMEWGVRPQVMIGHSAGEYVVACLAGVMSLAEALMLVATRGKLMERMPSGAMTSVPLTEEELIPLLDGLSIAAVNDPSLCVASGAIDAIERLETVLAGRGLSCTRLQTSHAFHSEMMTPILDDFLTVVKGVELKPPQIPFISSVTGSWITAEMATDANYWVKHLRHMVRFSDGISELLKEPGRILLEIGPGQTLASLAKHHPNRTAEHQVFSTLGHRSLQQPETFSMLSTLGKLWTAGVKVDWNNFYRYERRHRITLPTYPFERQRYWIDTTVKPSVSIDRAVARQSWRKKDDIKDWFYIPVWKQSPPIIRFQTGDLAGEKLRWLVFIDDTSLSNQLVTILRQEQQEVITVSVGKQFLKLSDDSYQIDPKQREDYQKLINRLVASNRIPQMLTHLWCVSAEDDDNELLTSWEKWRILGYNSLLFLAQALGQQGVKTALKIAIVSNGIYRITGQERLSPVKAIMQGICNVFGKEYANIDCGIIDIDLSDLTKQVVANIISELNAEQLDLSVAYRGNSRWIRVFEPLPLNGIKGRTRLRQGGVYLITGGLGGVGLELAQFLARTVQAKLILIGRRIDDQDSVRISKLQAIEEFGGEVLVLSADVSDRAQLEKVIVRGRERFGRIHGIIHSAGVPGGGLIQMTDAAAAENRLAAKVKGTLLLDSLFKQEQLDLFVLCSSHSSILSPIGQSDYAAANAFLDEFAHYRNAEQDSYTVSINWDRWQETGMAVNTSPFSIDLSTDGGMLSQEGIEVFNRVLFSALPQVIVSVIDFNILSERFKTYTGSDLLIELSRVDNKVQIKRRHPRPALTNPYSAPNNEIEQKLASVWQDLLGIDQVGVDDNFFELGGDSVSSIRSIAKAKELGLQLTPTHIYQYQTIAELAAVLNNSETTTKPQDNPLPLTPNQLELVNGDPDKLYHYQSMVIDLPMDLDDTLLGSAISQLLARHDALRMRFMCVGSQWQQSPVTTTGVFQPVSVDLSVLVEEEYESAIETTTTELAADLDISSGSLIQAALLRFGTARSPQLLLCVHRLAIDEWSWQILLSELITIYYQLNRGEAVQLPPIAVTFSQWVEQLHKYAESGEAASTASYWLAQNYTDADRIPIDWESDNIPVLADTVTVSLTVDATAALLDKVPKAYQTQLEDPLLAALIQAFSHWTENDRLLVEFETSGRRSMLESLDLSGTVGCLSIRVPILIELPQGSKPDEALKSIKEQLRQIPNNGLDYGILCQFSRYSEIGEQLRLLPRAQVSFQHCSSTVKSHSKGNLIAIRTMLIDGKLQANFHYYKDTHRRTTIEILASEFLLALQTIITHCQTSNAGGYTPSDFPHAGLNQEELDELMAELGNLAEGN
ncbi:MAG: SDR family NAD(P)-dependent oxidoreductase, partial [Acidobacteriota bacterium]